MDWRQWNPGVDVEDVPEFERLLRFDSYPLTVDECLQQYANQLPLLVRVDEGFDNMGVRGQVEVGQLLLVFGTTLQPRVLMKDDQQNIKFSLPATDTVVLKQDKGTSELSLRELSTSEDLPFTGVVQAVKDADEEQFDTYSREASGAGSRCVARPGDTLTVLQSVTERVLVARRVSLDWPKFSKSLIYMTEGTPLVLHVCIEMEPLQSLELSLCDLLQKALELHIELDTEANDIPEEVTFHRPLETGVKQNREGNFVSDNYSMVEFALLQPEVKLEEKWIDIVSVDYEFVASRYEPAGKERPKFCSCNSQNQERLPSSRPPPRPAKPSFLRPDKASKSSTSLFEVEDKQYGEENAISSPYILSDINCPIFEDSDSNASGFQNDRKISSLKKGKLLHLSSLSIYNKFKKLKKTNFSLSRKVKKSPDLDVAVVKPQPQIAEDYDYPYVPDVVPPTLNFKKFFKKSDLLTGDCQHYNRKPITSHDDRVKDEKGKHSLGSAVHLPLPPIPIEKEEQQSDGSSVENQNSNLKNDDYIPAPSYAQVEGIAHVYSLADVPQGLDQFEKLSIAAVGDCLRFLHLENLVEPFKKDCVDGLSLLNLNKQMLVERFDVDRFTALRLYMFVNGHRPMAAKKHEATFTALKDVPQTVKEVEQFSVNEVGQCLSLCNFPQYVQPFQDAFVDGRIFLRIDEDMLITHFCMRDYEARRIFMLAQGHRPS